MTYTAQHYIVCHWLFGKPVSGVVFGRGPHAAAQPVHAGVPAAVGVFGRDPGCLFAAILLQRYYNSEVARIDQQLLEQRPSAGADVDRDLAGLQATLQTLALSRSLSVGDHESFYRQAAQVRDYVGAHVMLRDASGQHLDQYSCSARDGAAGRGLPGDARCASARKPVVTGIVIGSVARSRCTT